jgi:tetratricopeptide (TPR) repeat protein
MAVYEQAVRTVQQRNFPRAAELLGQLVGAYSHEKELVERARLYLNLCERHIQPPDAEPQSVGERLYAATLALNAADPERAIGYLERVLHDEAANDRALYLLAAAHAARGDAELAVGYLRRAIATNPENRALARTDPDLDSLRSDEAVAALLEGPIRPGDGDPRRNGPSRNGR